MAEKKSTFIRGYHENQEICTLEIGGEHELEREPLNSQRSRWEGLRGNASTRMN